MPIALDTWVDSSHPGNGVAPVGTPVERHSVAKTQRSYDPAGLDAICGSCVYSVTPGMRQAYPDVEMNVDQIPVNTGACAC